MYRSGAPGSSEFLCKAFSTGEAMYQGPSSSLALESPVPIGVARLVRWGEKQKKAILLGQGGGGAGKGFF